MPLRVEPVRTKADLHRFVTLPWSIYAGDPHWVPPLIGETKKLFHPEQNPFFAFMPNRLLVMVPLIY